ncbi:hypothetical protein BWR18_13875 [Tateyamaria omphalii]|uniref:YHYH domain-containing protein n=1 Tax=Tateyamaria omphalii TaxID=299262 RepID=A0A1P8N0P1_9RHOB|nr:hypothetical protein BWR18_13875 [Tateyamaria omphalii]
MKFVVVTFAALTLATPTLASVHALKPLSVSGPDAIFHGGGCRKSSPPGQCCHAGSQPYHCH